MCIGKYLDVCEILWISVYPGSIELLRELTPSMLS
jgi:hypothetical protein